MYSNLPQVLQFMSYADKRDHEKAFDSDHAGVEQNPNCGIGKNQGGGSYFLKVTQLQVTVTGPL